MCSSEVSPHGKLLEFLDNDFVFSSVICVNAFFTDCVAIFFEFVMTVRTELNKTDSVLRTVTFSE